MSLQDALAMLQAGPSARDARDAVQAVHLLCANVVAHPDEPRFRRIRLVNPHFQATLARHAGGLEALLALGFIEREDVEPDDPSVYLILDEPELEADLDGWSRWYDALKTARDDVLAFMADAGIPPLPVAVKGGDDVASWAERGPRDECEVLHGQAGGGT